MRGHPQISYPPPSSRRDTKLATMRSALVRTSTILLRSTYSLESARIPFILPPSLTIAILQSIVTTLTACCQITWQIVKQNRVCT